MFEYSYADIQAQVAALPQAFQLWFNWMFLIIVLAPVLFLHRRQGRVAAGFSLVFLVLQYPMMLATGLSNLLSLTHIVVWLPLTLYLLRELHLGRIRLLSPLGIWASLASATAIISLVFDFRDFGKWILGERGVVEISPSEPMHIPWVSLTLIVVALIAAGWYAFSAQPGSHDMADRSV